MEELPPPPPSSLLESLDQILPLLFPPRNGRLGDFNQRSRYFRNGGWGGACPPVSSSFFLMRVLPSCRQLRAARPGAPLLQYRPGAAVQGAEPPTTVPPPAC